MTVPSNSAPLDEALRDLGAKLRSAPLELRLPRVVTACRARDELVGQIDDHLLPRLRELDAPLLAVVGGSTGAGKSTLVNSIVGAEISPAGVLRPTTRAPVLLCNPEDVTWFSGDRVLPRLARTTGKAPGDARTLHLVWDAQVPAGLALLDAPDIDSVVVKNRELAKELLVAADLWLFVTTAARYADAVPWDLLRTAQQRSIALAIVLNRVPEDALDAVPAHLEAMLETEGLTRAPVFTIPEAALQDGLIAERHIEPLISWLRELSRDAQQRGDLVRMTLEGALNSIVPRTSVVADGLDEQTRAGEELKGAVERAYALARDEVTTALSSGGLLRGEVLARWHEFIGTGDLMRTLEARIGWLRDRVVETITGRPAVADEIKAAVESSIESIVVAASDKAAERAVDEWSALAAGRELLDSPDAATLGRSSAGLRSFIDSEVRSWQGFVLELVSAEGRSKRVLGRVVSFGVNAAGAALMVAVFAQTGGLTGGELAVAGGAATVSQKLLEALFGDQAVRELTDRAREDLLFRIDRLLAGEATRFEALVRPLLAAGDRSRELRAAAELLERARA